MRNASLHLKFLMQINMFMEFEAVIFLLMYTIKRILRRWFFLFSLGLADCIFSDRRARRTEKISRWLHIICWPPRRSTLLRYFICRGIHLCIYLFHVKEPFCLLTFFSMFVCFSVFMNAYDACLRFLLICSCTLLLMTK